jgi:hypothetical protein
MDNTLSMTDLLSEGLKPIKALLLTEDGRRQEFEIEFPLPSEDTGRFYPLHSARLLEGRFWPATQEDAKRWIAWLNRHYDLGADPNEVNAPESPISLRLARSRELMPMDLGDVDATGGAWLELRVPARLRFMPVTDADALQLRSWLERCYEL